MPTLRAQNILKRQRYRRRAPVRRQNDRTQGLRAFRGTCRMCAPALLLAMTSMLQIAAAAVSDEDALRMLVTADERSSEPSQFIAAVRTEGDITITRRVMGLTRRLGWRGVTVSQDSTIPFDWPAPRGTLLLPRCFLTNVTTPHTSGKLCSLEGARCSGAQPSSNAEQSRETVSLSDIVSGTEVGRPLKCLIISGAAIGGLLDLDLSEVNVEYIVLVKEENEVIDPAAYSLWGAMGFSWIQRDAIDVAYLRLKKGSEANLRILTVLPISWHRLLGCRGRFVCKRWVACR